LTTLTIDPTQTFFHMTAPLDQTFGNTDQLLEAITDLLSRPDSDRDDSQMFDVFVIQPTGSRLSTNDRCAISYWANRNERFVLYLGLDDQHWNIVPDGATWPKVLILTEDMATPTMLLEAYGFGTTMDPEEEDE